MRLSHSSSRFLLVVKCTWNDRNDTLPYPYLHMLDGYTESADYNMMEIQYRQQIIWQFRVSDTEYWAGGMQGLSEQIYKQVCMAQTWLRLLNKKFPTKYPGSNIMQSMEPSSHNLWTILRLFTKLWNDSYTEPCAMLFEGDTLWVLLFELTSCWLASCTNLSSYLWSLL